jgi:hypothetical protein
LFHRASEYDMVRFGWDVYSDVDFTFADIVGVLANAWAGGFNGTSDVVGDYQPAEAVYDAAVNYFSLSKEAQWIDYMSDNGFDRGL